MNRLLFTLLMSCSLSIWAQSNENFVRLVEIEVDPNQISAYKQLLNESINTSVSVEEGVLQYHVVTDKKDAFRFTLLEIYKDEAAYLAHIKTAHFLKYKQKSAEMVKTLKLIDVNLEAQVLKND